MQLFIQGAPNPPVAITAVPVVKSISQKKGKNNQSKILIKTPITKYQKLKKLTLRYRDPQHSKKKRINKKFPASNPPAHTFPPFTHNPCYTHTPKTCTTTIQCKPRSPKATQIYLRSSNSRDKGEQNKNNTTLKKPVCQADCVCCAVRYVFNLSLKSSSVCTLLISYGISFHNLLPEYDMVLLKSCVLPLGINKLLLVTDLVL